MDEVLLRKKPERLPADRQPSAGETVYIWLDESDMLPELARRCLHLDCDRIEVATLRPGGGDDGRRDALLVRISSPPYYVVEWTRARPADKAQVFTEMFRSPGLFIEWGYEHPLADMWRKKWRATDDGWLFFSPEHPEFSQRRTGAPEQWRSIYDALDLKIDVESEALWRESSEDLDSFSVTVRMVDRLRPSELEMLVAGPEHRAELELQLANADPETLERIEVSVQQDEQGGEHFILRDRRAGDDLILERFPGRRFARFMGIERLLLPVDRTLKPSLRRNLYRELFDLERGALTLVVEGPAGDDVRLFRVPEASFERFEHLVEHLVAFEDEQLQTIFDRSQFDLGPYQLAESRPDLLGRQKTKKGYEGKPREDLREKKDEKTQKRESSRGSGLSVEPLEDTESPPSTEDISADELTQRARELEQEMVLDRPSGARWESLADIYSAQGSYEDAMECRLEALWHGEVGALFGAPNPGWRDRVELLEGLRDEIPRADSENDLFALRRTLGFLIELLAGDEDGQALVKANSGLRGWSDELPIKYRWLGWRIVLEHNHDERTYEEQRDTLLAELNATGLDFRDTPTCIRQRIIQGPSLDEDEGGDETPSGRRNLLAITQYFQPDDAHDLRRSASVSIARVAARNNWHGLAEEILEEARAAHRDLGSDEPFWRRLTSFFGGSRSDSAPRRSEEEVRSDGELVSAAWTQLMIALSLSRIAPDESDQMMKQFERTTAELSGSMKALLQASVERLRSRAKSSDSQLVSSPRMLFPSQAASDDVAVMLDAMEAAYSEGRDEDVYDLTKDAFDKVFADAESEGAWDARQLAVLLRRSVAVLRQYKWDEDREPTDVLAPYAQLVLEITPEQTDYNMYYAIARFAAARALLDLGETEQAIEAASATLSWLADTTMDCLDFIDLVRDEALMFIELVSPSRRAPLIGRLMRCVDARRDLYETWLTSSTYILPWLEMLDQIVEATVSQSRFAHRLLRDWEEREEFNIRQVLLTDTPHRENT